MGNLTTIIVFVWSLNILMFIMQLSTQGISQESSIFYDVDNNLIGEFSVGGNITMPDSDYIAPQLDPSSSDVKEEKTGIFFIDVIASIKSWVKNSINYIVNIVMAPYNILNSISFIPSGISGAISLLWYAITILSFVAFIFGRVI